MTTNEFFEMATNDTDVFVYLNSALENFSEKLQKDVEPSEWFKVEVNGSDIPVSRTVWMGSKGVTAQVKII